LEGIIAKSKGSLYEPGRRSGAWVKYKINRSQEFVIGGYTLGNPFDALIVGFYEGAELKFAAKVRNGFVPYLRKEIYRQFKGQAIFLRMDQYPSSCNQISLAIKASVMPYALRFYLYPFVAGVLAFVAAGLLAPYGRGVNLLFALAAAYLVIVIGRRVLGRKR